MRRKTVIRAFLITLASITLILALATGLSADRPDGSAPEKIMEFLKENGYNVASPSVKEITIPAEFNDVYKNYNKLQKEQGFDLAPYKGETALCYSFPVIGYINEAGQAEDNIRATILVCDGKIIGGDISSTRLDGFMKGIR